MNKIFIHIGLLGNKVIEERLKSFSLRELKAIAKHIGLNYEDADKDSLIEEIAEAYEDNKLEKQVGTNLAMLMKSKKFHLLSDVDDFLYSQYESEELVDINLQKESKIHLMLRDPSWGFSYWSFSNTDLNTIKHFSETSSDYSLYLRVFKCKEGESCKIKGKNRFEFEYFDIIIDVNDYKWYINLPDVGYFYYVELYLTSESLGQCELLAKSNIIFSPLLRFDQKFSGNIDETLLNSSLYQTILSPDVESLAVLESHKLLSDNEKLYSDGEI